MKRGKGNRSFLVYVRDSTLREIDVLVSISSYPSRSEWVRQKLLDAVEREVQVLVDSGKFENWAEWFKFVDASEEARMKLKPRLYR